MSDPSWNWLFGILVIAGIGGCLCIGLFVTILMKVYGITRPESTDSKSSGDPPQSLTGMITGILERIFFVMAICFGLSGTAIAMVAWTGFKGATYWQKFTDETGGKTRAYIGVMGSIMSMMIAMIASKFCDGSWVLIENPFGR